MIPTFYVCVILRKLPGSQRVFVFVQPKYHIREQCVDSQSSINHFKSLLINSFRPYFLVFSSFLHVFNFSSGIYSSLLLLFTNIVYVCVETQLDKYSQNGERPQVGMGNKCSTHRCLDGYPPTNQRTNCHHLSANKVANKQRPQHRSIVIELVVIIPLL